MPGRRTYRTRAIVLDRTKLAEQDLILALLREDGCEGRVVAKGARKPGGRLAARVELFCETDFLLAAGRSLDVVSEAPGGGWLLLFLPIALGFSGVLAASFLALLEIAGALLVAGVVLLVVRWVRKRGE